MIQTTGSCWVDTDIICLAYPSFAADAYAFCRQADAVSTLLVNNAVLRLPPSEPALAELVATAEAAVDVDQKWGALGPFLLTPVLTKYGLYERALDPHVCYPGSCRRNAQRRNPAPPLERSDRMERLRLRSLPAAGLLSQ